MGKFGFRLLRVAAFAIAGFGLLLSVSPDHDVWKPEYSDAIHYAGYGMVVGGLCLGIWAWLRLRRPAP